MAVLTVAGIDILPDANGGFDCDPQEIGDRARAFDGTMRASITARKRTWTVKTSLLSLAEAATLEAALTATPTCTASGDLMGSTVTVWPKLGKPVFVATAPPTKQVVFTLDEA